MNTFAIWFVQVLASVAVMGVAGLVVVLLHRCCDASPIGATIAVFFIAGGINWPLCRAIGRLMGRR